MENTNTILDANTNTDSTTKPREVDSNELLDVIMGMEENYHWFNNYNMHLQCSLENEWLEFRNESQVDFASFNKQLQELLGEEYKNISEETIWAHIKKLEKPKHIKKKDIKSKEDFMERFYFLHHEVLEYLIKEQKKLVKHTKATLNLIDKYYKKICSFEEGDV